MGIISDMPQRQCTLQRVAQVRCEDFASMDEIASEPRVDEGVTPPSMLTRRSDPNLEECGNGSLEARIVTTVCTVIIAAIGELAFRSTDAVQRLQQK
jgi:hypothetical protein